MLRRTINKLHTVMSGINAIESANRLRELEGTMKALAASSPDLKILDATDVFRTASGSLDCIELGERLSFYGSDKSTRHGYHTVYAYLLGKKRGEPLKILEIGIGTNHTDIPSNMGREGKPGASLRAFRDWGESFLVFGADVDKRILFSEERIETFFVDQTKSESFEQLARHFTPNDLDLVIDDGLHTPWANLNTINATFGLVKPGGSIVIEDILDRDLPIWKVASAHLKGEFSFIRFKNATVLLIQKIDSYLSR